MTEDWRFRSDFLKYSFCRDLAACSDSLNRSITNFLSHSIRFSVSDSAPSIDNSSTESEAGATKAASSTFKLSQTSPSLLKTSFKCLFNLFTFFFLSLDFKGFAELQLYKCLVPLVNSKRGMAGGGGYYESFGALYDFTTIRKINCNIISKKKLFMHEGAVSSFISQLTPLFSYRGGCL